MCVCWYGSPAQGGGASNKKETDQEAEGVYARCEVMLGGDTSKFSLNQCDTGP